MAGAGLSYLWELQIVYKEARRSKCSVPFGIGHQGVLVFSQGKPDRKYIGCIDTRRVRGGGKPEIADNMQQPSEAWDYWIEHCTKPGDLVADPFACMGTIGAACKKAGLRKYIGTEIRADVARAGQGRINQTKERGLRVVA
jgi:hypothetical protein